MKTNMLDLQKELNIGSEEDINKRIRNIQSKKSRLRRQKMRKDYKVLMGEVLEEEEKLKSLKLFLYPKVKSVAELTEDEIAELTMDETLKAIKNMQSRKCLNQHISEEIYQESERQEELLLEHKEALEIALQENVVAKSEIRNLLQVVEAYDEELTKEYVVEQLMQLLNK